MSVARNFSTATFISPPATSPSFSQSARRASAAARSMRLLKAVLTGRGNLHAGAAFGLNSKDSALHILSRSATGDSLLARNPIRSSTGSSGRSPEWNSRDIVCRMVGMTMRRCSLYLALQASRQQAFNRALRSTRVSGCTPVSMPAAIARDIES